MLKKKIDNDLKDAVKAKDQTKISTLRMLKAGIENAAIAKRPEKLEEADILGVLSKQIKQHKESIEQFQRGDRLDLVQKEKAELKILESYMPKPLTKEEIIEIVEEAIKEVGAQGNKDLGKIMKVVMPKVKGRAEGKTVNQMVSEALGKLSQSEEEKEGAEA